MVFPYSALSLSLFFRVFYTLEVLTLILPTRNTLLRQFDPHRPPLPCPICLLICPVVAFRIQLHVKIVEEANNHQADLSPSETTWKMLS